MFSFYRTRKMSKDHLWGSALYFDNFCAVDKNVSLGSKRSIETTVSRNSCFLEDKSFWPIFPGTTECDKTQETLYNGPQAFVTITEEFIKAIFQDLRGCWKQIFEQKKADFPVMKKFCPPFFRFIQHDKIQGKFYKGPRGFLTFIVQMIKSFLWDLRGW